MAVALPLPLPFPRPFGVFPRPLPPLAFAELRDLLDWLDWLEVREVDLFREEDALRELACEVVLERGFLAGVFERELLAGVA